MKRAFAALLALALALGGFALAEDGWPGRSLGVMYVVNCEEWVSLRASPDTSAEVLARVPLGAWVSDCESAGGGFIRCDYEGDGGVKRGYILSRYLAGETFALRAAGEETDGAPILTSASDFAPGDAGASWSFSDGRGHTVYCLRVYGAEGEQLRASCFDANGGFAWGLFIGTRSSGELDGTDAYLGGTEAEPLALVYSSGLGLAAIDFATGRVRWTLDRAEVYLGASQTHIVDGDGTLYVGGYYGPSPVAVSRDGRVLWQSDAGEDAVWLYGLRIEGDALVADYDAPDGDGYSRVTFDRATGAVLGAE